MTKKTKNPDASKAIGVAAGSKKKEKKSREAEDSAAVTQPNSKFDAVGKVESLRFASDSFGNPSFQFTLKSKDDRTRDIAVDLADSRLSDVMTQAVIAAAKQGAKLAVRLAEAPGGAYKVSELEVRF